MTHFSQILTLYSEYTQKTGLERHLTHIVMPLLLSPELSYFPDSTKQSVGKWRRLRLLDQKSDEHVRESLIIPERPRFLVFPFCSQRNASILTYGTTILHYSSRIPSQ
jgi:hypothetical protein